MNPKPAPVKPAATNTLKLNQTTEEIGGGILALLIIAGVVAAILGRRRKRREQEEADAQTMAFEPFETAAAPGPEVHEESAAVAAPAASAFAWGTPTPESAAEPPVERDDRRPGETWVERAYRGPTPNNPSVSLKARLRRAAFFDKRERDVAAGRAAPVDMDAGLPDALVEEQERELA